MKVKVITLPDAVERQEKIKSNFKLKGINYDIVYGVGPADITFINSINPSYIFNKKEFKINKSNLLKYTNRLWIRFGEIAALMAHYKLWKNLLESEEDFYLICEDDCLPSDNFILSTLDSYDYSKIDLLYLQAVTAHYQNKDKILELLPCTEWDKNLKHISQLKNYMCEGLASYCITKSGAKKLCSHIEIYGYDGPVDNIITRLDNFECVCPINLNNYFYLDDTSSYSYTHTGNFLNKYDLNGIELQSKNNLLII